HFLHVLGKPSGCVRRHQSFLMTHQISATPTMSGPNVASMVHSQPYAAPPDTIPPYSTGSKRSVSVHGCGVRPRSIAADKPVYSRISFGAVSACAFAVYHLGFTFERSEERHARDASHVGPRAHRVSSAFCVLRARLLSAFDRARLEHRQIFPTKHLEGLAS